MTTKRHNNGGVRKVCPCPRGKWSKCDHPWHFSFKWQGTHYRFSLDRELGSGALRPNARRAEREHAEALVAAYGSNFDVTARIDTLAAAERTIVAIARALDGWEHPNNVLVLDEPTASLHGDEAEQLFVAVRRVAQRAVPQRARGAGEGDRTLARPSARL